MSEPTEGGNPLTEEQATALYGLCHGAVEPIIASTGMLGLLGLLSKLTEIAVDRLNVQQQDLYLENLKSNGRFILASRQTKH